MAKSVTVVESVLMHHYGQEYYCSQEYINNTMVKSITVVESVLMHKVQRKLY